MTTLTLCSPALPSARRQTRRLAASPQRMLPFPAPMARSVSDESRSRPFAHAIALLEEGSLGAGRGRRGDAR